MSNHSLTARGTDLPFSHKSVMSTSHAQNIICSKALICRQLFAGFTCFLSVKLIPNFTRHHLITHTNIIYFIWPPLWKRSISAYVKGSVGTTHLALFGQCMNKIICPRVVHVWHKNRCVFRNAGLGILVNWNLQFVISNSMTQDHRFVQESFRL